MADVDTLIALLDADRLIILARALGCGIAAGTFASISTGRHCLCPLSLVALALGGPDLRLRAAPDDVLAFLSEQFGGMSLNDLMAVAYAFDGMSPLPLVGQLNEPLVNRARALRVELDARGAVDQISQFLN